jgi:hypothetical protein
MKNLLTCLAACTVLISCSNKTSEISSVDTAAAQQNLDAVHNIRKALKRVIPHLSRNPLLRVLLIIKTGRMFLELTA